MGFRSGYKIEAFDDILTRIKNIIKSVPVHWLLNNKKSIKLMYKNQHIIKNQSDKLLYNSL